MNDKMASLWMGDMAVMFAAKEFPEMVDDLERRLKGNSGRCEGLVTRMLQSEAERTSNYYLENNLMYTPGSNETILFQENVFINPKEAQFNIENKLNTDMKSVNDDEINKIAIMQGAISNAMLKYMKTADGSFNVLPVLVYLGPPEKGCSISQYFGLKKAYQDNNGVFSKFAVMQNKSFLFLNVREINWNDTIKIELHKVPEDERPYTCKKVMFASYYSILVNLYDGQVDSIFYPLYKLKECIQYLLNQNKEIYLPYIGGILESLSNKLSLMESGKCIYNRYEIENYLNEFLNVSNLSL